MNLKSTYKSLPIGARRTMSLGAILALVVALPLFVWAIVNLNFNQKEKAASGEPVNIVAGEPMIGLVTAPITIVGYMDFQCPYCKTFVDDTFSTILSNYPNDVRFVFKDFPLLGIHPHAENAAIAGQCAFAQEKFWEMHNLIFENQDTLTEASFTNFATQLNLDLPAYIDCYNNKTTLPEVQDDMTEGNFKGVTGTPTFFINGTVLVGAQPFSAFKTIIDAQLAALNPTSSPTSSPTATPTASPIDEYVEGEPNSCGGTCGSNYNCKANLYCYKGYCRNPICSNDTDCNCSNATIAPTAKPTIKAGGIFKTATPKPSTTAKSSIKPTPYVSDFTSFDDVADEMPLENQNEFEITSPETVTTDDLKNRVWANFSKYLVGLAIVILIGIVIFNALKKRNKNIVRIMPPTNI